MTGFIVCDLCRKSVRVEEEPAGLPRGWLFLQAIEKQICAQCCASILLEQFRTINFHESGEAPERVILSYAQAGTVKGCGVGRLECGHNVTILGNASPGMAVGCPTCGESVAKES